MLWVSAPGKVILFGEHAVVYGEPAAAVAVNSRMRMSVRHGKRNTFNGYPLTKIHHSYVFTALNEFWEGGPLEFKLDSNIPSSAGMGSSAALSVCTSFLLSMLKRESKGRPTGVMGKVLTRDINDRIRKKMESHIARRAFSIEYLSQGGASPIDTSVVTHGHGLVLRKTEEKNFLWATSKDDRKWFIHHMDVPDMALVLGNTGIKSSTHLEVKKVRRYVERNTFGREVIEEIGQIVEEGIDAMGKNDPVRIGDLMNENHRLLAILGVSHPKLEKLLRTVRRHSYGAKLTGAGGGGSFIAISDRPEKVIESLKRFNIRGFKLELNQKGVRYEEPHVNGN